MLDSYEDILNVKDVCKILRIDRRTAYKLFNSGAIPAARVGREYRVAKTYLIDFITCGSSCPQD